MSERKSFSAALKYGLFVGMAAAILLAVGCASAKKSLAERASPDAEIRVFEVFGMDCPGCHGGAEKLVNRIEGIEASEADWEQKTLVVAVKKNANVGDDEIARAIREANFTPGGRIE